MIYFCCVEQLRLYVNPAGGRWLEGRQLMSFDMGVGQSHTAQTMLDETF